MIISDKEKEILAQFYFEQCFNKGHFNICGINDFYEVLNKEHIYRNGANEKLGSHKELLKFHVTDLKIFPKETKIKLVAETKNCFALLGYKVDDSKIK